jgi:hypothetical protein
MQHYKIYFRGGGEGDLCFMVSQPHQTLKKMTVGDTIANYHAVARIEYYQAVYAT